MLTIVVYHSKGGVGKTTLSGLLAQFMAGLGYAGAILDLDRQGSQTQLFGFPPDTPQLLGDVVQRTRPIESALLPVREDMVPRFKGCTPGVLALCPGGRAAQLAVDEVVHDPRQFGLDSNLAVFRDVLADLSRTADFAVLDLGPSDPDVVFGALVAADYILIPTDSERLSLDQLPYVLSEVAAAQQVNPGLDILGIVPTKTEYHFGRLRASKSLSATWARLTTHYDDLLLRDDDGPIDLPYDEDWKVAVWITEVLFSASVGKRVKADAMRFLNAVGAKIGIEAVTYE